MAHAFTTVVVVPRERFSFTRESLESILTHTPQPFELLYIDGGSPAPVREYLEWKANEHGFRLIRTNHYLSPNVARNLAAAQVRTKYVAFLDNDALVSADWLSPLVDCAESTDAWLVGPIYCEGEPIATRIHMAGGTANFVIENGRRIFREDHLHYGETLAAIQSQLRREPIDQIEFHCALVRMDVFERLGPLDEGLLSACEHTDLCLLTRAAGGSVYFEPSSVVTYVPPRSLTWSDLPYFRLRWCEAWNAATLNRFCEKWDLAADDPGLTDLAVWLPKHRRLALEPVYRALKAFGRRPAHFIDKRFVIPVEKAVNRARFPASRYVKPIANQMIQPTPTVLPLEEAA